MWGQVCLIGPAPPHCQDLLHRQLAEKWPTTPHVQHFRGLIRTGTTLPRISSRVTQQRFQGSSLSWWFGNGASIRSNRFYGLLPSYATEHRSYSWVLETWGPFPNWLDNPEACAHRCYISRTLAHTGPAWVYKIYIAGPILVCSDLPPIPNFLLLLSGPRPNLILLFHYIGRHAPIYVSASNACIGPLFRIPSSGNASAARPAILSLRSHMSSLSPYQSLNKFLTASIAVRSLAYCRIRADFRSVQVRAGLSLYNHPTYLETGPAAASYVRRTIPWSDKPYITCFFRIDCIHYCSSVGSPLNEGNLMLPINLRKTHRNFGGSPFFLVD